MNLNRRSLLKLSAASVAAGSFAVPTLAQQIDELVIAYNVNLPSSGPDRRPLGSEPDDPGPLPVGLRPVHPAAARPETRARPSHRMGLERGQEAEAR